MVAAPDRASLALTAQELADPVRFASRIFGETLYDKQVEMMRSVQANRRTAVVGANGTGKDYCVSRIIPWWLTTLQPSMVIVLGPTYRQVSDVVWNLMRDAVSQAKKRGFKFSGKMFQTPRWVIDDNWFATGIAVGKGAGAEFTLQGYHSPNLLAVITEAHAVLDPLFSGIDRLNPKRIVITGNPFVSSGRFFEAFHSNREMWNTIEISAYDTPNLKAGKVLMPGMVTLEDAEDRRKLYGDQSPLYRSGVLCEWTSRADDALLGIGDVQDCTRINLCERCYNELADDHKCDSPIPRPVLGVDVARYGNDKTVIFRRMGPRTEIIYRRHGQDTVEVASWVRRYCADSGEKGDIVVDEVGIGAGVLDTLRHNDLNGWGVGAFSAGTSARDTDRFANRSAEAWWNLKEAVESRRIMLPNDPALIGQLAARKYKIQSDSRIQLEGKDELRRQGRPSPDEADALVMTYYGRQRVPTLRML